MREQTTDDWTVGRHLTALLAAAPESIDRLSWSREQIDAHQEAAMRRLLAHAVEHSGFHARRLSGVDIDGWRLADLAALPVMTKHDMMGAFDSVLTDPSVTKATRRGSSRCSRSIAGLPRRPVPGDHLRRQFRRARRVRVGCRGVHGVRAVNRAPNDGQARLVRRHTRQPGVGRARRRRIADARNRDRRPADGRTRRSSQHVSDSGNTAVRGDRPADSTTCNRCSSSATPPCSCVSPTRVDRVGCPSRRWRSARPANRCRHRCAVRSRRHSVCRSPTRSVRAKDCAA